MSIFEEKMNIYHRRAENYIFKVFESCTIFLSCMWLHVKASPDSPDSPDSPKHFFEKYDVFLIENGKISDFKLF